MEAGLYNLNTNTLIASWNELVNKGLDISNDFEEACEEGWTEEDLSSALNIFNELNEENIPLKLIIPGNVKRIGENVFNFSLKECNLKEVIIEDGIDFIGEKAFYSCDNLVKIYIPDSVKFIGESAFECCTSLEEIVLPKNLKELSYGCFYQCEKLNKITLPENLKVIGFWAFARTGLESIEIPKNVHAIGGATFCACSNLKKVLLNDNLKTIEANAFCDCKNLKIIKIPKSVAHINKDAFGLVSDYYFPDKIIIQNELNKDFMDRFKNKIAYLSLDQLLDEGYSLKKAAQVIKEINTER